MDSLTDDLIIIIISHTQFLNSLQFINKKWFKLCNNIEDYKKQKAMKDVDRLTYKLDDKFANIYLKRYSKKKEKKEKKEKKWNENIYWIHPLIYSIQYYYDIDNSKDYDNEYYDSEEFIYTKIMKELMKKLKKILYKEYKIEYNDDTYIEELYKTLNDEYII
tara:strand:+ start:1153 stop:1638 length:486 start_codon:yes stop_codon:yes gene_type:complete